MIIFVSVFFIIGVIVALEQQKRYTSYVVLAPEATSMGMSQNLSDIAGAIGMDIGGGNHPSMPSIPTSIPMFSHPQTSW